MVFHWTLIDSKSLQISRTLLSILADLSNAVVWMVSARPLISNSSSSFYQLISPLPAYHLYYHYYSLEVFLCKFPQVSRTPSFLDIYGLSISSLGCEASCIVISFLVFWLIGLAFFPRPFQEWFRVILLGGREPRCFSF